MRQNAQRHVLESDRRAVEQLEVVSAVRLDKRSDLLGVKLRVVCRVDAGGQLFRRVIRKEQGEHGERRLPICHRRDLPHRTIQLRQFFRNIQSPVRRKSLKDRLRRRHFLRVAASAFIDHVHCKSLRTEIADLFPHSL